MIKYISLLTALTVLMKLEFPDPNYRKEFLKIEEVNFFREQAILETKVFIFEIMWLSSIGERRRVCVFPKALKASYLEMSLAGLNSNQSGPLADLKKKKKERWEGERSVRVQITVARWFQ